MKYGFIGTGNMGGALATACAKAVENIPGPWRRSWARPARIMRPSPGTAM